MLSERDEQLAALERWLTPFLEAQVNDLAERRAVHRFFTWHCPRRLRRRAPAAQVTLNQSLAVKREIRVACHLIRHLRADGSSLADCNQVDVDHWLAAGSTYRHEARTFVQAFTRLVDRQGQSVLDSVRSADKSETQP